MGKLFEECPNHNVQKGKDGKCLTCGGTGYAATGLTTKQVYRMVILERVLNGDVEGLTKEFRGKAEWKLRRYAERKGWYKKPVENE